MGTPSALHAWPPIPTNIPQSWLLVSSLEGNECEPLQAGSEHVQKTGPTLWDWEKGNNMSTLAPPYRKQKERCRHSPWLCRIKKSHTILKVSTLPTHTLWGNMKWAGVSKKGFREPQNLQQAWQVKKFLSQSSSVKKIGGSDCFFKCEDSNSRIQGTWKKKWRKHDPPKEHSTFSVTDPPKMEIYPMSNMNSKIVVVRKPSELQENTKR